MNWQWHYPEGESILYLKTEPQGFSDAQPVLLNRALALKLGITDIDSRESLSIWSGSSVPLGCDPVAFAYAGHQFGHYNPRLGDGRAVMLGQLQAEGASFYDVQLKGSGRTSFSRDGDGLSALGPVIREFIVSEAMHALGVPTTRSLAALATGERVLRREGMLPGGVMTRLARSHLRVGTFQYHAAEDDVPALTALADYLIEHFYPEAATQAHPYLSLLEMIITAQAELIAQWMSVGFIHGVMNTDNMSLTGETIDYGPCAFMEAYNPKQKFSFIDQGGRYAYQNQAGIGLWNLTRLAGSMLPLISEDEDEAIALAEATLQKYPKQYDQAWLNRFGRKIGLESPDGNDRQLVEDLLEIFHQDEHDFTLGFRRLADAPVSPDSYLARFGNTSDIGSWLGRWEKRLQEEGRETAEVVSVMNKVNPVYIPRNHLVERVIREAEDHGNYRPAQQLYDVLADPFTEIEGREGYARPAEQDELVKRTFCGT